jgi:predicted RNase H-like HicB family nuclease
MSKQSNLKILEYPAVFEPADEGGYNVSFPAFPGCVTFGRNFEEAKIMAKEVLELWLEELSSQGERIPAHKSRPIVDEVKVKLPSKVKIFYASNNC